MTNQANCFDFSGKNAVVTGGASGIGLAITRALVAARAQVYVLDTDEETWRQNSPDMTGLPGAAEMIACDVAVANEVQAIIERLPENLHFLINNAGVSHIGKLHQTTDSELDRIYRVNIKGMFNTTKACLTRLSNSGSSAIINISSIAAKIGIPDRFAYSMSKGAVTAMTRSIACDYLDSGIRCNAISPARIHTPFVDDFLANNYQGKEKEEYEKLAASQPVGRMGKPEEVAGMVMYLCSEHATFITGSDFSVDGGFTGIKL